MHFLADVCYTAPTLVERWVEIGPVFGKGKLVASLKKLVFKQLNTGALEWHHGTSRQRERPKAGKTRAFSKEGRLHRWMSWLFTTQHNCCWSHVGLRQRQDHKVHQCPPAMAPGLTDHIGSVRDWWLHPVLGRG